MRTSVGLIILYVNLKSPARRIRKFMLRGVPLRTEQPRVCTGGKRVRRTFTWEVGVYWGPAWERLHSYTQRLAQRVQQGKDTDVGLGRWEYNVWCEAGQERRYKATRGMS